MENMVLDSSLLDVLWDTRGYFFWVLVLSATMLLLEALAPWRPAQKQFRKQFGQDLFWLVFNAHYAGVALAFLVSGLLVSLSPALQRLETWNLLATAPLWAQFALFFVLKDLLEWCVHNLLHRVPVLWGFHKVHHTIEQLDWIGNFRFHWMEIVVYKTLTYLPLVVLGVDGRVILGIALLATAIGFLNHSNLNITWGPLRYVLNSSRMHVWHHMYALPATQRSGVNFGISLSVWDWLFRTAYWPASRTCPEQQPEQLGFPGIERYPRSLLGRLLYPLSAIHVRKR